MILLELFNAPFKWEEASEEGPPSHHVFYFKTSKGFLIRTKLNVYTGAEYVNLIADYMDLEYRAARRVIKHLTPGERKLKFVDILFMGYDKHGQETTLLTGKGDAVRVMSTVIDILKTFVAQQHPSGFIFTAERSEPSRVRLYDRLAKLINQSGYKGKKTDRFGERIYLFLKQGVHYTPIDIAWEIGEWNNV